MLRTAYDLRKLLHYHSHGSHTYRLSDASLHFRDSVSVSEARSRRPSVAHCFLHRIILNQSFTITSNFMYIYIYIIGLAFYNIHEMEGDMIKWMKGKVQAEKIFWIRPNQQNILLLLCPLASVCGPLFQFPLDNNLNSYT